jgi:hypothetical protein
MEATRAVATLTIKNTVQVTGVFRSGYGAASKLFDEPDPRLAAAIHF